MAFDPSLALQNAILLRLIASAELTALVPVDNIQDANGRPELMPCVLIGEGQTVYRRFNSVAYSTVHVWFQEPGLEKCKAAVSAIAEALRVDAQISGVMPLDGFVAHDVSIEQTRFLRDSHGSFSHGIVTVCATVKAVA
jgi:hypothetical protein